MHSAHIRWKIINAHHIHPMCLFLHKFKFKCKCKMTQNWDLILNCCNFCAHRLTRSRSRELLSYSGEYTRTQNFITKHERRRAQKKRNRLQVSNKTYLVSALTSMCIWCVSGMKRTNALVHIKMNFDLNVLCYLNRCRNDIHTWKLSCLHWVHVPA